MKFHTIYNPYTEFVAPRINRKITRDFDERNFYQSEYKPLTPVQSDLFVYKAFREYLEKNKERVPSMMHDEIEQEDDRRRHINKNRNQRRNPRFYHQHVWIILNILRDINKFIIEYKIS